MTVIGPYDRASFAEYTPLSAQDILMPAMVMAQQHEQLENQYAGLNDELQKIGMIVSHSNEPELQQRYQDYNTNLTNAANSLMEQGVNANTRDNALKLRSAYQSQIAPINMAAQIKSQLVAAHDDRMAKDQTYFGQDPRNITLTSLINNGMQAPEIKGLSGATLVKQAADMADQFAQKVASGDPQVTKFLKGQFGNQYAQVVNKFGMDPMSNDPDVVKVKNYIRQSVLAPYDMNSWADDSQKLRAIQWAEQGLSHLQGKDQTSHVSNKDYDYEMDLAKMRQEQAMKQKVATQYKGNPIFRTVQDTQTNAMNTTQLQKDLEFISQMHKNPSAVNQAVKTIVPGNYELNDPGLQIYNQPSNYITKNTYPNRDRWNQLVKKYGTNNTYKLSQAVANDITSSAQRNTGYVLNMTDNYLLNKVVKENVSSVYSKTNQTGLYQFENGKQGDMVKMKDVKDAFKDANIEYSPKHGLLIHSGDKSYVMSPELIDDKNRTYSKGLKYIDQNIKEGDYNSANTNINNLMTALYKQFNNLQQIQGKTLSNKEEAAATE